MNLRAAHMRRKAPIRSRDRETVAWTEEALAYAHSRRRERLMCYLEAVMEDLVFEDEQRNVRTRRVGGSDRREAFGTGGMGYRR